MLLVPNAALRWQPRVQNIVPEAREDYALLASPADARARRVRSGRPPRLDDEPIGVLWVRQGDFVRPIKVRIGLSDGVVTEISGDGLEPRARRSSSVQTGSTPSPTPCRSCRIPGPSLRRK